MIINKSISKLYAQAIYKFSIINNSLSSWKIMLKYMVYVSNHEKIKKIILSMSFFQQIREIFISVCGNKIDTHAKNFIKILVENKRLIFLENIYTEFISLCDAHKNILHITIVSAYTLTQNQINNIKIMFGKYLSNNINIKYEINKNIIDGFIIKYNDLVIDLSIKYQLKQLLHFLQY
ncbi:MAG: ATP synthase F1 subunit delta [Buchnera aphidicola (Nurudea shiraii)]